jgi:hypothetical protein
MTVTVLFRTMLVASTVARPVGKRMMKHPTVHDQQTQNMVHDMTSIMRRIGYVLVLNTHNFNLSTSHMSFLT